MKSIARGAIKRAALALRAAVFTARPAVAGVGDAWAIHSRVSDLENVVTYLEALTAAFQRRTEAEDADSTTVYLTGRLNDTVVPLRRQIDELLNITAAAMRVRPDDGDAELLARVGDFNHALKDRCRKHKFWIEHRDQVEARPDCPPDVRPLADPAGYIRHQDFLDEHRVDTFYAQFDVAELRCEKAVAAVFALPANTVRGALEKLKIAYETVIEDGAHFTDIDFRHFQGDVSWTENTIRDLERQAGRAGS